MLDIVSAEKEELIGHSRQMVSSYWDWFNERNTEIANKRKVGDTEMQVSNIAPVVEIRKSGESVTYYIVWKNHNKNFRKKMKKKFGKGRNASLPIHSYTSKSIPNILTAKCTWDTKRALEYETKFEEIRTCLKGLHDAEVRLRSSKRRLLNLKEKNESLNENQPTGENR